MVGSWNTIFSFWDGLFSGAMLVLGSVALDLYQFWLIYPLFLIKVAIISGNCGCFINHLWNQVFLCFGVFPLHPEKKSSDSQIPHVFLENQKLRETCFQPGLRSHSSLLTLPYMHLGWDGTSVFCRSVLASSFARIANTVRLRVYYIFPVCFWFVKKTRWWFQTFFIFTPIWGRFSKRLKPPTRKTLQSFHWEFLWCRIFHGDSRWWPRSSGSNKISLAFSGFRETVPRSQKTIRFSGIPRRSQPAKGPTKTHHPWLVVLEPWGFQREDWGTLGKIRGIITTRGP